jgi:exportin-1
MSSVFGFNPREELLIFDTDKWSSHRVDMLDTVVSMLFAPTSSSEIRTEVNFLLTEFQNHPSSWRLSSGIVQFSKCEPTKHLALQMLFNFTKKNWLSLSDSEQNEVRSFLCTTCVEYSKSVRDPLLQVRSSPAVLSKLNECLVSVVLHDWYSEKWGSFVDELCESSRGDLGVFTNNVKILTMISEEVDANVLK